MVIRIEIATRPGFRDPRGEEISRTVRGFLGIPVRRVRTRDVYRIEADLTEGEARSVLAEFTDPVLQTGAVGRVEDGPFDVAVSVGYKPGVTDPVGKSARVAIEDLLGRPLGARRRRLHLAPLPARRRRPRRRPSASPGRCSPTR